MLPLMLDPCYKSLQVVDNYVGHGNASALHVNMLRKKSFHF
jgi:hypothetical protein